MNALVKNVGKFISKNSPTILTILAGGGVVATAITASRAGSQGRAILDTDLRMREMHEDTVDGPTNKEIISMVWKEYIPVFITGSFTIACIWGSSNVSLKRQAALASAYSLANEAFKEYKNKVFETIGKNKEQKVRDEIAEDKLRNNPISRNNVIITQKGDHLCYDSLSGRYFKSDIEKIRKAVNDVRDDAKGHWWAFITLNEFYCALGLDEIKLGETLGWDLDKGTIDISFSSHITDTGEPCLVLDYKVEPKSQE